MSLGQRIKIIPRKTFDERCFNNLISLAPSNHSWKSEHRYLKIASFTLTNSLPIMAVRWFYQVFFLNINNCFLVSHRISIFPEFFLKFIKPKQIIRWVFEILTKWNQYSSVAHNQYPIRNKRKLKDEEWKKWHCSNFLRIDNWVGTAREWCGNIVCAKRNGNRSREIENVFQNWDVQLKSRKMRIGNWKLKWWWENYFERLKCNEGT